MSDALVPSPVCPICSGPTQPAGAKRGKCIRTEFKFRFCPQCHFTFVENPCTDYAAIYDENYYRGKGADPLLDYVNELEHPEATVREYEWRGLLRAVRSLVPLNAETQWLDFGCGNGGQVRYVRANSPCRAVGFEEGWVAERARGMGIPILTRGDLKPCAGSFDIVSAIEVMEHIADPVSCLKEIRALLKPGGLLFLTTGNAQPHRAKFLEWGYVAPEIHVSYFEPQTMERALTMSGFRAEVRGALPGFSDILRFKILKNLGVTKRSFFEKILPWPVLSHIADSRYKVSAHPIGWAV